MPPTHFQFDTGRLFSRPPKATLWLMGLTALLSILSMASFGRFGSQSMARALAFSPSGVLDAHRLWTLATYLFVTVQPLQLLLYLLFGLWMFGAQLERQWGARRFLYFFFVSGVGASFFTVLLAMFSSSLRGMPPFVVDGTWVAFEVVVLGWVLTNWNATVFFFFFPMRAPWILVPALLLPFLNIIQGNWEPFVTVLSAMAIGFVLLDRGDLRKRLILRARLLWAQQKLKRSRGNLRVVPKTKGDDDDEDRQDNPPRYLN